MGILPRASWPSLLLLKSGPASSPCSAVSWEEHVVIDVSAPRIDLSRLQEDDGGLVLDRDVLEAPVDSS